MKRLRTGGWVAILLGFYGTGFFWFGPGFLLKDFPRWSKAGAIFFPLLMLGGLFLLLLGAGILRRK